MEEANTQPAPLQGKRLLWLIPLPTKKPKTTRVAVVASDANTFYGRAMEWTHRADKVISLALGYLLAIASVLGFMDVLSNGQVLSYVPWAFYVWLAIMGLGVDFQLLLVIGRFPDLVQTVESKALRVVFILFNLGFLSFLAYMSATIAAVFTQHVDSGKGTVIDAMAALHIDAHTFVFERAWLATLLLVLMAVDRTLERWRIQAATQSTAKSLTKQDETPLQGNELADALSQIAEMNAATLKAVQQMNQQQPQVTIEQVTRVTAEVVKQSLEALPFNQPLQIGAPNGADTATQMQPAPFERDYKTKIAELLASNPSITIEEVMRETKCSEPTAKKWLERLAQHS